MDTLRSVRQIYEKMGRVWDAEAGRWLPGPNSRITGNTVQVHHTIVQAPKSFKWPNVLGLPDDIDIWQDMPGMLIETNIHVPNSNFPTNTATFHDIFNDKLKVFRVVGDLSGATRESRIRVLDLFEASYKAWGQANGWGDNFGADMRTVLEIWLRSEGVDI